MDAVRQALLGAGLTKWFANALVGLYQDYRRSGTGGYPAQVTGYCPAAHQPPGAVAG